MCGGGASIREAGGYKRHQGFTVGREFRAAQLLGEGGEGEVRPERLPVRQMEQQQEWGDLSRKPSLRGAKCRLSPAWVGGVNSELQGILDHSEDPLKLVQGQEKSLEESQGFRGKMAGPPWTGVRAQEPMG